MSERIDPALSDFQWRTVTNEKGVWSVTPTRQTPDKVVIRMQIYEPHAPQMIALANAALSNDDLRKITRSMIADLNAAVNAFGELAGDDGENDEQLHRLSRIVDALESYLPPEA